MNDLLETYGKRRTRFSYNEQLQIHRVVRSYNQRQKGRKRYCSATSARRELLRRVPARRIRILWCAARTDYYEGSAFAATYTNDRKSEDAGEKELKAFFYDPFKASPRYLFTAGGVGDWCCTIRSVRSRKGNGPYWVPVSAGKLIRDPESTEFNLRPHPQAENAPEEVKKAALELYANRRRLELYCDRNPYAVWTALQALDKEAVRRGFAQPLFAFVRDFTLYSEYANADLNKLVMEKKL